MSGNGATNQAALIELETVSKIFCTDEVETHALDGIGASG